MAGFLQNKVALVTGAGQGVGQGIAYALATEGAKIAVAGRTEATLLKSCEGIRERGSEALPIICDVCDKDQLQHCVDTVIQHFSALDILVNNAQIAPVSSLLDTTEEQFRDSYNSGPLATLRLMKLCHPHLKKTDGVIINLATSSALAPDTRGFGAYASGKEATRCLTRAAAHEWAADGIRVNCILPVANSPGLEGWGKANPKQLQGVLRGIPLGRIGDCEMDIGPVVAFLCGPESRYITAQSLPIDGGQTRVG